MSSSTLFALLCALIGLLGLCACGKKDRKTQLFAAALTTPVILPAYFYATQGGTRDNVFLPVLALILLAWYLTSRNTQRAIAVSGSDVASNALLAKPGSNAPQPPATTNTTSPAATISPSGGNTSLKTTQTLVPSAVQHSKSLNTGHVQRSHATSSHGLLRGRSRADMGLPPMRSTTSKLRTAGLGNRAPKLEKRHAASSSSDRSITPFNNVTESRKGEPSKRSQPKRTAKQAHGPVGRSLISNDSDEGTMVPNTSFTLAHSVGDGDAGPMTARGGLLSSRWAVLPESAALNGANSSKGTTITATSFKPAYSAGDEASVSMTAGIGLLLPQHSPLPERAALDAAESGESGSNTNSTGTSGTDCMENDLAGSAVDWTDMVERMDALSLGTDLQPKSESDNLFAVFPSGPVISLANKMATLSLGSDLRANKESDDLFQPFLGHSFSIKEEMPVNRPDGKGGSTEDSTVTPTNTSTAPIVTPERDNGGCRSGEATHPSGSSPHTTIEQLGPPRPEVCDLPDSNMDDTPPTPNHVFGIVGDDGEDEEPADRSQPLQDEERSFGDPDFTASFDADMIAALGTSDDTLNTSSSVGELEGPTAGAQHLVNEQEDLTDGERDALGEVDQGDGSNMSDDSFDASSGAGESIDTDRESNEMDVSLYRPAEPSMPDLQDSDIGDAGMAIRGKSKDDAPALEIPSGPPPHPSLCGNDPNQSSPYSTGRSAPDNNPYWSSSTNAYVPVSGSGRSYNPQVPSNNSAGPLGLGGLHPSDDVGRHSSNTTGSSEDSTERSASGSTNLTKASVEDTPEATHNSLPSDANTSENPSLCKQCKELEVTADDEGGICFDCSMHGGDAPSRMPAPASQPVKDSQKVAEGPRIDSGSTKRRRSLVLAHDVKTEDASEDIDHANPTKRGRVGDEAPSAMRAAFIWNPMYPTEEYQPLKDMTNGEAGRLVAKWVNCNVKRIHNWDNKLQDFDEQERGSRKAVRRMKSYLQQPEHYKELGAIVHRLHQTTEHGLECAAGPEGWNESRICKLKVDAIRKKYKSIEVGLRELEIELGDDFAELDVIQCELERFKRLTRDVASPSAA